MKLSQVSGVYGLHGAHAVSHVETENKGVIELVEMANDHNRTVSDKVLKGKVVL